MEHLASDTNGVGKGRVAEERETEGSFACAFSRGDYIVCDWSFFFHLHEVKCVVVRGAN